MQHGDAFRERERALEESFFYARNQELLAELKKKVTTDNAKQAIREICHLEDEAVLDKLAATGIRGESFAAMSLAPLVLVAWADGKIDERERRAVISAANSEGINAVCLQLLEDWLSQQPGLVLKEAWISYVGALAHQLSPGELKGLKASVMGRAEKVAKAAGGALGLDRISISERALLNELSAAFTS
ncbi:MAG: hypothetical protein QF918_08840 [Pirellulaceae bacterium]|jgi:hypothetical protein|nr:hypothetical protein [Pirellulaceae bacterium]MDP6556445.1 hypothetical protein [Pirellulaceae bacterium]